MVAIDIYSVSSHYADVHKHGNQSSFCLFEQASFLAVTRTQYGTGLLACPWTMSNDDGRGNSFGIWKLHSCTNAVTNIKSTVWAKFSPTQNLLPTI